MMRTKQFYFLLIFSLGIAMIKGQKINYSIQEAREIHDSIKESRWDIGGKVSQYSFRYMSEFFPVGMINKPEKTYQFTVQPKKSIDNITLKTKSGSISFENYLKKLHISSFIVLQKGKIVYEKYFSALSEDQQSLQSVSKVITSALITNLNNEKKIDLNQPIEKYIPELKNTDWQGISIKNILHMRSGMDSFSIDMASGPFTNPKHKNYQLESALGILPKAENTPNNVYKFITQMKKDTVAGGKAEYSNINTFVLGWLAEKVTGKKYSDLVSEMIWQPMGANSNAYVCLSDKGIPWVHGGISATLRDLARFGMLFTKSDITARKEKIISFAQVQEIFNTTPIDFPIPFKWAYQWDLADQGFLMKGGFGGQALYVHPDKEIVIAYFNYVDENWEINNIISDQAVNEILKATDTK